MPSHYAPIAVVGMSARFPGATCLERFWTNLAQGVESIRFYTEDELRAAGVADQTLADSHYVRAAAPIDFADSFDAAFFDMNPREAALIDPQHRVFLECAWHALEHAGYGPGQLGGRVGCYAGAGRKYYHEQLLRQNRVSPLMDGFQVAISNQSDFLATRTSFKLDLRGPSVTVQNASATSLVAIHTACRALQVGDCEMALAGACAIRIPLIEGYRFREGGIQSPDGHTRTFDARAAGTVLGSGAGVVVLKPLERAHADGDTVYAVIRGSAVTNDGAEKRGYAKQAITAPSVAGQTQAIRAALRSANVSARSISYLEAHGTATPVGDPVEIDALKAAFSVDTSDYGFCRLGAVKSNIGHTSAAAGMAGFIKTVLSLHHRQIPPTLNIEQPNPKLRLDESPFLLQTQHSDWAAPSAGQLRRAGVSSFGFGGVNAHMVLEESPAAPQPPPSAPPLLVLSSPTRSGLQTLSEQCASEIEQRPVESLAGIAYTLQNGRKQWPWRRAVTGPDTASICKTLRRTAPSSGKAKDAPPVIFLFPGHGSESVGMTRNLYEQQPLYRDHVDQCSARLAPHLGFELREIICPQSPAQAEQSREQLERTDVIQPALFVVETGLARLWQHWGVQPAGLLGYSIGQYASAVISGVMSMQDAERAVLARASLVEGRPEGAMLAIALPEADLLPLLGEELSVAATASYKQTIVSGETTALEGLQADLKNRRVACRWLEVSRAFHSAVLDPVLPLFAKTMQETPLQAPVLPFLSALTGNWVDKEVRDPAYWVREVREPVRFAECVTQAVEVHPDAVFLEVGPGQNLAALLRGHRDLTEEHLITATCSRAGTSSDDHNSIRTAAGALWSHGVSLDWHAFSDGIKQQRCAAPLSPFERTRHWLLGPGPTETPNTPIKFLDWDVINSDQNPMASSEPVAPTAPAPAPIPPITDGKPHALIASICAELLGLPAVGLHDDFFEIGGNSLIAVQLIARVRDALHVDLPLGPFLQQPTVQGLVDQIEGRSDTQTDPVDTLVAELSQLPPEEQAALIEEISHPPCPTPPHKQQPANSLDLSLIFFSGSEDQFSPDKYRLVIDGAKFADQNGLKAIWTPERHFNSFGGLYPNPAVLGAAIATATDRLRIRAGSVVPGLHDPVRIAEEWSVVDNLSRGRVDLAFASGFHPNDFVLAPDAFSDRRETLLSTISEIQRLWRGGTFERRNGAGNAVELSIYPRPVQPALNVWLACSGSPVTYERAGHLGANVLTALLKLTPNQLGENIALYRKARAEAGHDPDTGQVTLMLHTYVGENAAETEATIRGPFMQYLLQHFEFYRPAAVEHNVPVDSKAFTQSDREGILEHAYTRYVTQSSLCGPPDVCAERLRMFEALGVNEIACLVDFGIDYHTTMAGLARLTALQAAVSAPVPPAR